MILISILIFLVAIALPSLNKQLSPILLTRISSIILIYAGALSFNALYIQSIGSGIGIYSGLFHVTFVSQQLDTFILFISSLILLARPINFYIASLSNYKLILKAIKDTKENINEYVISLNEQNRYLPSVSIGGRYSLIILFSTLGSLLLVSSGDLVSMYLSIELQSFGLYILATLYRESNLATSAGLKYFLLGGLSSCLILLGAGLVYTFTGLTNLESIYSLISVSNENSISQGLTLGFVLIMVGFLFKIAAAPLHHWAPDVYDDSPTIVTIWLTILPKISILILLLEFSIGGIGRFSGLDLSYYGGEILTNLLLLSSLLSLLIGTILGLVQSRIKRLLAYSTISHVGFLLLALSVNTEQSIESFIFYIIQYSLTNLNTFLIILALGYLFSYSLSSKVGREGSNSLFVQGQEGVVEKDIRFISELKGQFISNPLLSISLSICLFSMAGIPPLMGFFSKQMVLYAAIQSGYYFISIVAIIVSVISASYYLKIVRLLFSESDSSVDTENLSNVTQMYTLTEVNLQNNDVNIKESDSTEVVIISGDHILTNFHSFLISTLTLSILLFILKPSLLLNSTQLLSLSLYNF
jgi:NADH-ubiquinone oxidoreductase chain 2